jgi:hypothetical protein
MARRSPPAWPDLNTALREQPLGFSLFRRSFRSMWWSSNRMIDCLQKTNRAVSGALQWDDDSPGSLAVFTNSWAVNQVRMPHASAVGDVQLIGTTPIVAPTCTAPAMAAQTGINRMWTVLLYPPWPLFSRQAFRQGRHRIARELMPRMTIVISGRNRLSATSTMFTCVITSGWCAVRIWASAGRTTLRRITGPWAVPGVERLNQ